ncbi:MAG: GNAT family N-acetyltransferase [Cyanobacteria bacterium J06648_16]
MTVTQLITTYLQMLSPAQLSPAKESGLSVLPVTIPCPELNRFLYAAVGYRWYWTDRRAWTYQTWMDYLSKETIQTWVGYVGGTPAGYVELEKKADGSVLIAYFGLLPQFIGQGHGGRLLTVGLEQAWAWGAQRVWVHTNNLDGPVALRNYQARGLVIYEQTRAQIRLPDEPLAPW